MALFFTLLYILTAYLSPGVLFGSLAEFRIELILAALALLTSVFALQGSGLARVPQAFAILGICAAVFISIIFSGWLGHAPYALISFLPQALTFFFVFINVRTRKHILLLVGVLSIACFYTVLRAWFALQQGSLSDPYLFTQMTEGDIPIFRIQGLGEINDPNDLAQTLVSLTPLLFLFWKKGSTLRNFFVVLLPAGLLTFGLFLTHSRGGIVGMLAVGILASRRKLGTIPSLIGAAVAFAGSMAIGWTGGREISVEAGSDRLEAWSTGLQLIRSHPIFGVGFERFGEYFYITAHNSVVVCAAELGLFGLFFWVLFLLTSIRDLRVAEKAGLRAPDDSDEAPANPYISMRSPQPAALSRHHTPAKAGGLLLAEADDDDVYNLVPAPSPIPTPLQPPPHLASLAEPAELSAEQIRGMARLSLLSLAGFLVTGWFLSRAYVMLLFLYGGLAQVIYQMALTRGLVPARMRMGRAARLSLISSIGLILVVYVILRLQNLVSH